MTTHAIELPDSFNTAHLLIIQLQLSGVTSYFDEYYPNIAENENEDSPKIYLTAEEPPWDLSMNEYSERESGMLNYQDLPQQQGDQCMSVQLSHTHWLMLPLMLWIMIIL